MPRKSRLRIRGNDRFIMMLCRDARRRWMQYGENRKAAQANKLCELCNKRDAEEWDHITPLGQRPYTLFDLPDYLRRLIDDRCQGLCKPCHKEKTAKERKKRSE